MLRSISFSPRALQIFFRLMAFNTLLHKIETENRDKIEKKNKESTKIKEEYLPHKCAKCSSLYFFSFILPQSLFRDLHKPEMSSKYLGQDPELVERGEREYIMLFKRGNPAVGVK